MMRPLSTGLFLWTLAATAAAADYPVFVDATPGSGIDYVSVCGAPVGEKGWLNEGMGNGAGWLDYDLDGHLDLYVVNGSAYDRKPGQGETNRLYRGDGKGHFVEVTDQAGVGHRGWGYGVTVGDYDNDGDPDLYLTNLGPNVLYRNDGDGTFTDVTAQAGVAGGEGVYSSAAAFFDMDNDGDLDLYVGNYMVSGPGKVARSGSPEAIASNCAYKGIQVFCGPMNEVGEQNVLYRNDGGGKFTDVSAKAGIRLDPPRYTLGLVTGDVDNDGDQDIYVANDSVSNSLWQNQGDGTFLEVGLKKMVGLNADGRAQAGMGTHLGDFNDDGWLDIVVTNFSQDLNTVYKSLGGKFYIDDSMLVGMAVTNLKLSWGCGFHDFDLDGDEDLFIANGHVYPMVDQYDVGTRYRQKNHLFLNEGGRFTESAARCGPGLDIERSFRAAVFGDYDDDGDLDVFLTTLDDRPVLLRNDTPRAGRHWLELRLIGKASNRDAVGARVRVTASGRTILRERLGGGSYLSSADPRLHFGLGGAAKADRIEIRWPSGHVDTLENVTADRRLTVEEGGKVR